MGRGQPKARALSSADRPPFCEYAGGMPDGSHDAFVSFLRYLKQVHGPPRNWPTQRDHLGKDYRAFRRDHQEAILPAYCDTLYRLSKVYRVLRVKKNVIIIWFEQEVMPYIAPPPPVGTPRTDDVINVLIDLLSAKHGRWVSCSYLEAEAHRCLHVSRDILNEFGGCCRFLQRYPNEFEVDETKGPYGAARLRNRPSSPLRKRPRGDGFDSRRREACVGYSAEEFDTGPSSPPRLPQAPCTPSSIFEDFLLFLRLRGFPQTYPALEGLFKEFVTERCEGRGPGFRDMWRLLCHSKQVVREDAAAGELIWNKAERAKYLEAGTRPPGYDIPPFLDEDPASSVLYSRSMDLLKLCNFCSPTNLEISFTDLHSLYNKLLASKPSSESRDPEFQEVLDLLKDNGVFSRVHMSGATLSKEGMQRVQMLGFQAATLPPHGGPPPPPTTYLPEDPLAAPYFAGESQSNPPVRPPRTDASPMDGLDIRRRATTAPAAPAAPAVPAPDESACATTSPRRLQRAVVPSSPGIDTSRFSPEQPEAVRSPRPNDPPRISLDHSENAADTHPIVPFGHSPEPEDDGPSPPPFDTTQFSPEQPEATCRVHALPPLPPGRRKTVVEDAELAQGELLRSSEDARESRPADQPPAPATAPKEMPISLTGGNSRREVGPSAEPSDGASAENLEEGNVLSIKTVKKAMLAAQMARDMSAYMKEASDPRDVLRKVRECHRHVASAAGDVAAERSRKGASMDDRGVIELLSESEYLVCSILDELESLPVFSQSSSTSSGPATASSSGPPATASSSGPPATASATSAMATTGTPTTVTPTSSATTFVTHTPSTALSARLSAASVPTCASTPSASLATSFSSTSAAASTVAPASLAPNPPAAPPPAVTTSHTLPSTTAHTHKSTTPTDQSKQGQHGTVAPRSLARPPSQGAPETVPLPLPRDPRLQSLRQGQASQPILPATPTPASGPPASTQPTGDAVANEQSQAGGKVVKGRDARRTIDDSAKVNGPQKQHTSERVVGVPAGNKSGHCDEDEVEIKTEEVDCSSSSRHAAREALKVVENTTDVKVKVESGKQGHKETAKLKTVGKRLKGNRTGSVSSKVENVGRSKKVSAASKKKTAATHGATDPGGVTGAERSGETTKLDKRIEQTGQRKKCPKGAGKKGMGVADIGPVGCKETVKNTDQTIIAGTEHKEVGKERSAAPTTAHTEKVQTTTTGVCATTRSGARSHPALSKTPASPKYGTHVLSTDAAHGSSRNNTESFAAAKADVALNRSRNADVAQSKDAGESSRDSRTDTDSVSVPNTPEAKRARGEAQGSHTNADSGSVPKLVTTSEAKRARGSETSSRMDDHANTDSGSAAKRARVEAQTKASGRKDDGTKTVSGSVPKPAAATEANGARVEAGAGASGGKDSHSNTKADSGSVPKPMVSSEAKLARSEAEAGASSRKDDHTDTKAYSGSVPKQASTSDAKRARGEATAESSGDMATAPESRSGASASTPRSKATSGNVVFDEAPASTPARPPAPAHPPAPVCPPEKATASASPAVTATAATSATLATTTAETAAAAPVPADSPFPVTSPSAPLVSTSVMAGTPPTSTAAPGSPLLSKAASATAATAPLDASATIAADKVPMDIIPTSSVSRADCIPQLEPGSLSAAAAGVAVTDSNAGGSSVSAGVSLAFASIPMEEALKKATGEISKEASKEISKEVSASAAASTATIVKRIRSDDTGSPESPSLTKKSKVAREPAMPALPSSSSSSSPSPSSSSNTPRPLVEGSVSAGVAPSLPVGATTSSPAKDAPSQTQEHPNQSRQPAAVAVATDSGGTRDARGSGATDSGGRGSLLTGGTRDARGSEGRESVSGTTSDKRALEGTGEGLGGIIEKGSPKGRGERLVGTNDKGGLGGKGEGLEGTSDKGVQGGTRGKGSPRGKGDCEVRAAVANAPGQPQQQVDLVDDVPQLETAVLDDLQVLKSICPPSIKLQHLRDAVSVVLDMGSRPRLILHSGRVLCVEDGHVISADDLKRYLGFLGGEARVVRDRRVAVAGTLHRASVNVNRRAKVIGLTVRLGRILAEPGWVGRDILAGHNSVLLVGNPGSGKTTALRWAARALGRDDDVWVVDTMNEIAGDRDSPHAAVGQARRVMVPAYPDQEQAISECLANHTPHTLIVDEIASEGDVRAIAAARRRGVRVLAGVHGSFHALVHNDQLRTLLGLPPPSPFPSLASLASLAPLASLASLTSLAALMSSPGRPSLPSLSLPVEQPMFDAVVEMFPGSFDQVRVISDIPAELNAGASQR